MFAEALAKVPVRSLAERRTRRDEPACRRAPACQPPFECWGDTSLPKGLQAVQQPVIQPLFDTPRVLDLLVEWGAAVGDPPAGGGDRGGGCGGQGACSGHRGPAAAQVPATTNLRAAWAARIAAAPADAPAFEAAWNEVCAAGGGPRRLGLACTNARGYGADLASARGCSRRTRSRCSLRWPQRQGLRQASIAALPLHFALADGRSAKTVAARAARSDSRASPGAERSRFAPRRFDEMKLQTANLVEIDAGHAKVVARRTGTRACTTTR